MSQKSNQSNNSHNKKTDKPLSEHRKDKTSIRKNTEIEIPGIIENAQPQGTDIPLLKKNETKSSRTVLKSVPQGTDIQTTKKTDSKGKKS